MRRFAKSTVHRTLTCITVVPVALVAGFFFLEERAREASSGAPRRVVFRDGFGLTPGGSGTTAALAGRESEATTSSETSSSESRVDGQAPESREIGQRRIFGPGAGPGTGAGTEARAGTGKADLPTSTTTVTLPGAPSTNGAQPPSVDDLPPGTGLLGQYWDHDSELTHIPNLDISGADITRVDPLIDFLADGWNLPFKPLETWATCWRGYLKVLNPGHYVFVLGSDDGALLELDNQVVCGQDRLQGYYESHGEADLAKGLHVLKLRYFNNRGPGLCRLFWVGPGGGDPQIGS